MYKEYRKPILPNRQSNKHNKELVRTEETLLRTAASHLSGDDTALSCCQEAAHTLDATTCMTYMNDSIDIDNMIYIYIHMAMIVFYNKTIEQ